MASQEWITGSNLGEYSEETSIHLTIEYKPSTNFNKRTLDPILLSSNVPSEINLSLGNNNTIIVDGVLPKVNEDTEYYFTYRLKEVNVGDASTVTDISDRYFTFKSLNIPVSWNDLDPYIPTGNNCIFEINLKDYLDHSNGNETFKKVNGTLPEGVIFNENGTIVGYIEEDIEDITNYSFTARVYLNGLPVEGLEDKEFIISVDPETMEQKPTWTTEPNLGNVNKNEVIGPNESRVIKLNAMNLSGSDGIIRFMLAPADDPNMKNDPDITGLPPGISMRNDGNFLGTCTTTQVKDWYFGAYAVKIVEQDDNIIYSDYRKFMFSTNRGSAEHEITWTDPTKSYVLGTFVIGENISLQLPLASAADGSIIKYSLSGNTYPKGIELSDSGLISGTLNLQDTGTYDFEVMAKTDFTYITRKFRMNVKKGLGESALKLYLRINLEYKDEFTDIKDQLNPNTLYNNDIDTYNISNFPKIDVATLKCYDREVLAAMMNFGNPEIVRFGLTKSLPYSHIDSNGNLTANYEVFYKSIDENTYQWDPIEMGNYDFQAKLDQLKTTGDIDENAEIEFNNETYKTSVRVWKLLGEVPTYAKLLACDTSELKDEYFAKVLEDETHNKELSYYIYNGDPDSSRAWNYVGNELPQYPDDPCVNPMVETSPNDSYQVFNFKNVRDILSQRIYVYNKEGTYYYDEGNQQIVEPSQDIDSIKKLHIAKNDMYRENVQAPFIKAGNYYITDEDEELVVRYEIVVIGDVTKVKEIVLQGNPIKVNYESHIVSDDDGHIYVNVLFKPTFNSPNFMILLKQDSGEVYHVNEIINPWCFDFNRNTNISIDTVPAGEEMVLPNIKTSDVNLMVGGDSYVVFLDTSDEPLPMWKRKQAEIWKPNTTYKAKEIIIYSSLYYKVKQQFTSGNEFIFDSNLLEQINGDVIDVELPKNYFPTLDLGYYESGTNRRYLKDLNDAETKGDFWYRKDFLFWELIAEPVYNQNIDTFGIPFYSTQNRMELVNTTRKKIRTFEIDCDTPNAVVSIEIIQPDGTEIHTPTPVGNRWKVEFVSGSHITWSVTAGDNYYSEGGDYIIVSDEKHVISLKKKCIITIYPQPADANVTLIADGYKQGRFEKTYFKPILVANNHNYIEDGVYYINYENPSATYDDGVKVYNELYNSDLERLYYNDLLFYRCIDTNDTTREKQYIVDIPGIVTYTINPTPADAIVTLTPEGQEPVIANSVVVPVGTRVSYKIEKERYLTISGTTIINSNRTANVELESLYATITVTPTPSDATVTLTSPGAEQIGNSIEVEKNKTVTYTVSKDGYVTKTDYIIAKVDKEIPVELVPYVTLTVESTPDDAEVILTATGYIQEGNSITVPKGTRVAYKVSKQDYLTVNETITVNETATIEVELIKYITVTINPDPASSTVILTAPGFTQINNSIKVAPNTIVNYMVSKSNYSAISRSVSSAEDITIDVKLEKYPVFTIVAYPDDADIKIISEGYPQIGNTISVPPGAPISYSVSKENYYTVSDTITMKSYDDTVTIELEKYPTFTIYPNPRDAIVTLTAEGYTQEGNSITVPKGTRVAYSVVRKGYTSIEFSNVVNADTDLDINLEINRYSLRINPDPSNSTVTLTAEGQEPVTAKSITVNYGTPIRWYVELEGQDILIPRSGNIILEEDTTLNIKLKPGYYVNLDDYDYTMDNNEATLNTYIGNDQNVDIPHEEE